MMHGRQDFSDSGRSGVGKLDDLKNVGKVRVYEVAKEMGLPNKTLVAKIQSMGIDVKNHMSSLDSEDVQRVKRILEKERQESLVEERLSPTVIRRRSSKAPVGGSSRASSPIEPPSLRKVTKAEPPAMARRDELKSAKPAITDTAFQAPPKAFVDEPSRRVPQTSTGSSDDKETVKESLARKEAVIRPVEHPITVTDHPGETVAEVELRQQVPSSDEPEEAASLTNSVDSTPPFEKVVEQSEAPQLAEGNEVEPVAVRQPEAVVESTKDETMASSKIEPTPSREEAWADTAVQEKEKVEAISARDKLPDASHEEKTTKTSPPSSVRSEPEVKSQAGSPPPAAPASTAIKPTATGAKPATPTPPPVVHRYAPGYKPGMQYGPRAREQQHRQMQEHHRNRTEEATASDGTPTAISAADAMRMIAPMQKPKVVVTDLDGIKPGQRREMLSHKELFAERHLKTPPNKKKRKVVGGVVKKAKKTEITTPAQHKRIIRIENAITVGEMAHQMGIKSTEVLKRLWAMGLTNVSINQNMDTDTASLLASEFGYEVEDRSFNEEQVLHEVEDTPEDLQPRPPVVTVMGHVDHGKTSLLDAIRNTAVASGEAGGITQHIGAYKVATRFGEIVFLDTPGHEAFTHMRARGAQCTDIVVLVVAADDGVMPQTVEAIDHAKDAKVPIIVAVNKIDRPNANTDRVRTELSEKGLIPEDWGGETICVNVSARTKAGIDELLENILLQAEVLELKANPKKLAKGTIIEAKLDKARGVMCSVLVQEGVLHVGDIVITGEHMGKVRAILDDKGYSLKEAGPCTPVEILGLSGVPEAGDPLNAVADEKTARTLAEHRRNEHRKKELAGTASKTYEEILGRIKSGEIREIKLLVKADVHGSAEAVRDALTKLSTEKVSTNVISAAVGGIHETDVNLAKAAGAIIVGFNVRAAGKASQLAEREGVEIRIYDIIYEMLDDVKNLMQGLLPKERREHFLGRAEVRETFSIPKIGVVAGCGVQEGKITRNSLLRLVRDNIKIYDGKVSSLRRFKEDVREVVQGYECGLTIDGYNDIRVGDVVEAYEIEEITPSLT